ncbi:MAG: SMP-30/gluconolactonase/LRE family protein [Phycisphaerales bacterium]|nr:MAG: SMP-30/gluconolactonase/LRE family protein [Phycisphaerales bacterium]
MYPPSHPCRERTCAGEQSGSTAKRSWVRCILPLAGLTSLIWFLVRVIPKPSRATYPCQRVAFPLASGFIVWLLGLFASVLAFRKAKQFYRSSRAVYGLVCLLVAAIAAIVAIYSTPEKMAFADDFPANVPVGVAKGLHPGRVVWVHDTEITDWAGPDSGQRWFNEVDQVAANRMVSLAIRAYAGVNDDRQAWDLIFRHFNQQKGKGDVGYTPGEKIAMKLNWTTCNFGTGGYGTCDANYNKTNSSPDLDTTENTPEILHALLSQLVHVVGVEPSDISMGDPTGQFANHSYNYLHADFPEVNYMDDRGGQGRTLVRLSKVPFYWSSPRAAGTRQDYVPEYYAEAEYFINVPLLKSHDGGGITVCAKNHYGSLQRTPVGNFRTQGTLTNPRYFNLHDDLPGMNSTARAMGRYRPLVDLMGHAHIGGKTVLYIVDAIFAGRNWDSEPSKWNLPPFGDGQGGDSDWPCSLLVSMDPVAIDSVAYDFLIEQWPEHASIAGTTDYLVEAALAYDPPSGTVYDPDHAGDVARLPSLGVHEHWNNPTSKQYSRNLGTGDGIELVKVPGETITGDIDRDNDVDTQDLVRLSDQWLDRVTYVESQGQVVVEAERFSSRAPGGAVAYGISWQRQTSAEAMGDCYLQVLPDYGRGIDLGVEYYSPHVGYQVDFSTPGTYYLWLKGLSGDEAISSLHYGVDGTLSSAGGEFAVIDPRVEEPLVGKQAHNWLYLDIGLEQAGWTDPLFDDTGWRTGQARLGYGGDGEITEVRYGPNEDNRDNDRNNKYITTYFRKHFTVSQPERFTALRLSILRDDGAVAYLNGREVARSNMPTGPVDYHTIVRGYAVGSSEEDTFFDYDVDPGYLLEGDNVVAVEVHQYAGQGRDYITSSDTSFDMELVASGSFSWSSRCPDATRPAVYIPSAGIHTLDIWMREDGLKLDRVLLTADPDYDPADSEPAESAYGPAGEITADLNSDGLVNMTDFVRLSEFWLQKADTMSLMSPDAQLTEVHSESAYFEGPTWDPASGKLYFSQFGTPNKIMRLNGPGNVTVWSSNARGANGTFLSNDGRLLVAEGETNAICSLRIGPDGPEDRTIIASDPSWIKPNDLCQTPRGDIYFTTPDFTSRTRSRVYRVSAEGDVTAVITDMTLPNGIIASNAGAILYVSDSHQKFWMSYPISPDGTLGTGSVFFNPDVASTADPDGMTIDERGNLYLAGRGGVWIVSKYGIALAFIEISEFCSNVTFGGPQGRTLFITCQDKVYALDMLVRGGNWAR